jgi:DNA adenine methylase
MYRVNLNGDFNVPIGTKSTVQYEPCYLDKIAAALRYALLRPWDFERTIARAQHGDFVFIDPPYTVMHNNNNFVKYNASLFSWVDQQRLAVAVKEAGRRGAMIMLLNGDHDSIRSLYAGFGNHYSVSRSSVLSAKSQHRRKTTELLITNYSIDPSRIMALQHNRRALVSNSRAPSSRS